MPKYDINTFETEGIDIFLTYEDAVDVVENQPNIDGQPFILKEEEFPLVATVFPHSSGEWLFYFTHSSNKEYDLDYEEFIEEVN